MVNMDSTLRREAGDIIEKAEGLVADINTRLKFLSKMTQDKLKDKLQEVFTGISTETK